MFKFLRLVIFLFIFTPSVAQVKFSATIEFLGKLSDKDINVLYDNGLGLNRAKGNIKQNKIVVSDFLKAKYAIISIEYENKRINFGVNEKSATIIMEVQNNQLKVKGILNAFEFTNLGEKELNNFIAKESNDLQIFLENNSTWNSNDTLTKLFWKKKLNLDNKKFDFVKENSTLYYAFSLFRRELIHSHLNIDSLLETYHTIFPDSFKLSLEGTEILKVLNGRNIKKNLQAPDFLTKDIKGKTVSLKHYKGNYILLTFWSTSCGPCIEELPTILQISNHYSSSKLNIISISTDISLKVFLKAVKKHQMNWTNVFGDVDDLTKSFGVKSIPQIYLINDKGMIVYSREEEKDYSPQLLILNKILEERLSKL